VFGWMVDRLGGYALAWLLIAGVFVAATLVVAAWQRTDRAAVPLRVAA
jgi:hypothetical protein